MGEQQEQGEELKQCEAQSGACGPRTESLKTSELESLSGRELDALIAERVMGFTRAPEPPHRTDNRQIGGVLYYLPDCPWDRGQQNVVPYFTSDIAAAMQVVEKMATELATVEMRVSEWGVSVSIGDYYEIAMSGEGTSLPRAICLAALQASASAPSPEVVSVPESLVDHGVL